MENMFLTLFKAWLLKIKTEEYLSNEIYYNYLKPTAHIILNPLV